MKIVKKTTLLISLFLFSITITMDFPSAIESETLSEQLFLDVDTLIPAIDLKEGIFNSLPAIIDFEQSPKYIKCANLFEANRKKKESAQSLKIKRLKSFMEQGYQKFYLQKKIEHQCEICQIAFATAGKLNHHSKTHGSKDFKCPYENCDYEATYKHHIWSHLSRKHKQEFQEFSKKNLNCNVKNFAQYILNKPNIKFI